jgi:hypothetical protein
MVISALARDGNWVWQTSPDPVEPNNDVGLFGGDMYLQNYGVETRIYYLMLEDPHGW